jgi:hypothetical protein
MKIQIKYLKLVPQSQHIFSAQFHVANGLCVGKLTCTEHFHTVVSFVVQHWNITRMIWRELMALNKHGISLHLFRS